MAESTLNNPQYWLGRAAEMRCDAAAVRDVRSKQGLLRLASEYDWLAERAEERRTQKAS